MAEATNGGTGDVQAVIPHLVVGDVAGAIEFYKGAFGAEEVMRMPGPDGRVMHGEVRFGDFLMMIAPEMPDCGSRSPLGLGGTPVTIHLRVPDCDGAFARATEAGCTAVMPPADMFWGDRYGRLTDPYGHSWSLSTHLRDVSMEEMKAGMEAAMAAPAE